MQQLLQKNRAIKYLFLVLGGVLTCLPIVIVKLGFLQWFGMSIASSVILVKARDEKVKYVTMYKYGFVYFMSFYLTAFHWFAALYPLSFIDGMTKPSAAVVVAAGWLGLSLLQTVVSAFVPVLIALIARRGLCKKNPLLLPIGAGAVYTIFEWMQTLTWAGVPWARLAIGQTGLSAMFKNASLLGSYFITLLIVVVNFYIAEFMLADDKLKKKICISAAVLIFAANAALGGVLVLIDGDKTEKVTVAAVQPNISSQEKWSNEIALTKERMRKYAYEAAKEGAELIVFSETVMPYHAFDSDDARRFLSELAKNCNADLLVGCFTYTEGGSQNSLIFVDSEGNIHDEYYSKRHLVPFGEYVPMRELIMTVIPPLAELSLFGDDLIAGDESVVIQSSVGKIGGLVCFDSIYEELARDNVKNGAEIIAIGTNDSWFYDSAGVKMHNAQAMLRAVENGRYVIRAANTGISSIIDHNGRILDFEEPLVEGIVVADISARSQRTLYSYVGNLIVWLSMAFFVLSFFEFKKPKNIDKI